VAKVLGLDSTTVNKLKTVKRLSNEVKNDLEKKRKAKASPLSNLSTT